MDSNDRAAIEAMARALCRRATGAEGAWAEWALHASVALAALRDAGFWVERWRPIGEAPKGTRAQLVWCPERKNTYTVTWWQDYDGREGWKHFGYGDWCNESPSMFAPLPPPPPEPPHG